MPQMTDSAGSQLKKYGTGLKSSPIYVELRPNLESRVTHIAIYICISIILFIIIDKNLNLNEQWKY